MSFGSRDLDPETTLRRAEMALQDARHNDTQVAGYTVDMDEERRERLLLLGDLELALKSDQFWLAFQPQVDIRSGRMLAVEALIRWKHPTRGNIPPGVFIPLAENAGFIREVTDWMTRQAARQQRQWRNEGRPTKVSVNISAYDLRDKGFASIMEAILWDERVTARDFVFEVTESALVSNGRIAMETLRQLNDLGSHNAIDDFGTGYSSLAYLRDLPVQELKIDRAFVIDLVADPRAEAILRTITRLAADLDMNVVTEGIEDAETLRLAVKAGCNTAQGYYFSRPLAAEDLGTWLTNRSKISEAAA
jgi:EAL domain-containing protein (putative c-di-GMP-specific phosphodiesterase class I)